SRLEIRQGHHPTALAGRSTPPFSNHLRIPVGSSRWSCGRRDYASLAYSGQAKQTPRLAIMIVVTCIYLDNNATTRTASQVIEARRPDLEELGGNPSSLHTFGQAAQHAIETAREQVAGLINAQPREIVFTSGGTEADNLAILGTLAAHPTKRHIVTTAVE